MPQLSQVGPWQGVGGKCPGQGLSGRASPLPRYKSLCPDTWPHWHGPPAEGVERLIQYMGYTPEEYKLGR